MGGQYAEHSDKGGLSERVARIIFGAMLEVLDESVRIKEVRVSIRRVK